MPSTFRDIQLREPAVGLEHHPGLERRHYRPQRDVVNGLSGDDVICGIAGKDRLFGAAGHDTLKGGLGDGFLNGGAGNDLLEAGMGADTVRGGAGIDTQTGTSVTVDLSLAGTQSFTGGTVTISGIKNLRGGAGNDSFGRKCPSQPHRGRCRQRHPPGTRRQ
ncbi:calcium-binding protein [Paracoccus sp. (in: a-proteobacteria)]|uniref:calcium-binding protein n=1 Tax=Paracoccus sp. TaxID=267 RepID=UPI00396C6518